MMKQIFLSLLLVTGICFQATSQLIVSDNNNVGIGVTAPVSKLAIGQAGNTSSTLYVENTSTSDNNRAAQFYKSASGGAWSHGMTSAIAVSGASMLTASNFTAYNSSPLTSKRTYGVRSTAGNATSGYNYAVYGRLGGTNNGAAIFGATPGKLDKNTGGVFAGYFRGNVYVENNLDVFGILTEHSDINVKKDIRFLADEETSHIEKLATLSAIKFKYKNPAELNDFDPVVLDTMKVDPRKMEYTDSNYTEDKIGLSAQDVQLVYPELVKKGNDGYLRMNYIGLIPVLIEALKEQEAEIEVLRNEIEKLKSPEITKEVAAL